MSIYKTEESADRNLFDNVGTFIGPVQRRQFEPSDIVSLRDEATKRFISYPHRLRLPGMNRDLNDDDKRALAFFEASVQVLNRLGALDFQHFEAIKPAPFTAGHEVIDEGIIGHSFTPQK